MKAEDYYHYSYFKPPAPLSEKCLLVSDCMGYTADPEFIINRKNFYNNLAFYVYQGTFYVEQYGRKFELHKGDVGILNLMDEHIYYSDPDDTAHLLWFHFRGAGTNSLMELLRQNETLPCINHLPQMEQSFLKNFDLTSSNCSDLELAGHMYGLLMQILQESTPPFGEDEKIPDELQKVVQFMTVNSHENLTLDDLSFHAGMGKYHFSHMFKKWYGISPMRYYMGKKMELACCLLLESELSIDEIAEQLGYLDTGYFRKAFKNYFGSTPAAYRKNQ